MVKSAAMDNQEVEYLFFQWCLIHQKSYTDEEARRKLEAFCANRKMLGEYLVMFDPSADLSQQELEEKVLREYYSLPEEKVVTIKDHRLEGSIGPVRDQGSSNCC